MDTWEDIAIEAYQAYSKVTGNKNFRGEEMPKFSALPDQIREAWRQACCRAVNYCVEIKLNGLSWNVNAAEQGAEPDKKGASRS